MSEGEELISPSISVNTEPDGISAKSIAEPFESASECPDEEKIQEKATSVSDPAVDDQALDKGRLQKKRSAEDLEKQAKRSKIDKTIDIAMSPVFRFKKGDPGYLVEMTPDEQSVIRHLKKNADAARSNARWLHNLNLAALWPKVLQESDDDDQTLWERNFVKASELSVQGGGSLAKWVRTCNFEVPGLPLVWIFRTTGGYIRVLHSMDAVRNSEGHMLPIALLHPDDGNGGTKVVAPNPSMWSTTTMKPSSFKQARAAAGKPSKESTTVKTISIACAVPPSISSRFLQSSKTASKWFAEIDKLKDNGVGIKNVCLWLKAAATEMEDQRKHALDYNDGFPDIRSPIKGGYAQAAPTFFFGVSPNGQTTSLKERQHLWNRLWQHPWRWVFPPGTYKPPFLTASESSYESDASNDSQSRAEVEVLPPTGHQTDERTHTAVKQTVTTEFQHSSPHNASQQQQLLPKEFFQPTPAHKTTNNVPPPPLILQLMHQFLDARHNPQLLCHNLHRHLQSQPIALK